MLCPLQVMRSNLLFYEYQTKSATSTYISWSASTVRWAVCHMLAYALFSKAFSQRGQIYNFCLACEGLYTLSRSGMLVKGGIFPQPLGNMNGSDKRLTYVRTWLFILTLFQWRQHRTLRRNILKQNTKMSK